MVDTKKEQERDELHRAIWAIADELRGAVDGWDFKNYVLGTMFYRYISENLCNYINSGELMQVTLDLILRKYQMRMQKKLEKDWLKKKDSSFCPVSCSAMYVRMLRMTKI